MSAGFSFTSPDASPRAVLRSVRDWSQGGEPAALIIITAIVGRTARSIGTMMGVAQSGCVTGSISGGCFDAAVAAEAVSTIKAGAPRLIRLGAGSPWIDIKLPCGGGLDLLILPRPDVGVLDALITRLERREPAMLAADQARGLIADEGHTELGWNGPVFRHRIAPARHLLVAGNGGEAIALARLGAMIDSEVTLATSEPAHRDTLPAEVAVRALKTADDLSGLLFDRRTAVALFFHDHDWEPPLLLASIRSPAWFIGAMGSRDTHAARCATLTAMGATAAELARITSPIGAFGPVRDPRALAVSALAQIIASDPETR